MAATVNGGGFDEACAAASISRRLSVVDRLRGFVIALMALDHVRDFFNRDAFLYVAEDLTRTTPAIFATRWVTHICAPTFVLLAGVSIRLQQERGKIGWTLSRFLLARGAWLILLEITLVSLLFNFAWPFFFVQVIWAIGASMVLLAFAVWLPRVVTLALAILIVAGGEVLTPLVAPAAPGSSEAFTLLLQPGVLPPIPSFVAYPAVPWFGIMALGYVGGRVFALPDGKRDLILVTTGLAMLAAFAALRGANGYGNPSPWELQADGLRTAMSFINVAKYPPSLDYTLVTLGVALLLAPALARISGAGGRMLDAFGRTPFFTYLLHILLIHTLAVAIGAVRGIPPGLFTNFIADPKRLAAAGWGLPLGATYIVWVAVLLALWPLSTWFARVKARRTDWWLSFI